ncbi:MAG: substrate-binding domain-containing protein, partial [Spirochaetia bacterium]|nr:substrate-binding domain-containing protein [Spirochaetia bacterium]
EGPWSAARRDAFAGAMSENRLALHREWIGKDADVFSRLASAKAGKSRPTALVFDTDETLFRFEDFAKKKKIRIPEDVAVAGADNDHFEAGRRGRLLHTSAAVDFYGQGRAGALMMVGLLSGKIPPFGNVVTIQPKLIVRRSSLRRSLIQKSASEDSFREVVTSYLEMHATEEEAGDEIARHVGMARYYFRKKFSRVFGRTLAEHLASLRAEKAGVLLRSTDKPVTWIMHEVGFSTHQTFTAAFRKRFGMRAQEYRKSG